MYDVIGTIRLQAFYVQYLYFQYDRDGASRLMFKLIWQQTTKGTNERFDRLSFTAFGANWT